MTDEQRSKTAGVIAPPPLIALAMLGLGIGLNYLLRWMFLEVLAPIIRLSVAGLLFVIAGACLLTANGLFQRANTSVKPWVSTSALVTTGIYRYTRNPMYVGFLLISFAIAIGFALEGVLVSTCLLWVILHFGVIKREERYLTVLFGQEYKDYCQQVSRYGFGL